MFLCKHEHDYICRNKYQKEILQDFIDERQGKLTEDIKCCHNFEDIRC